MNSATRILRSAIETEGQGMHTSVRVLHLRSAATNGIGGDECLLLRVYIITAHAFVPHS